MSRQFISLVALFWAFSSMVSAQYEVDPSLGSYSCYPCGRQLCGFADGGSEDVIVDTSGIPNNNRAPPRSCKEIQYLADMRALDPEVCSIYSQITLSSSDPCDCRRRTSAFEETSTDDDCPNPNQPQPCALCGNGKIIGDPEKIIDHPVYPVSCVSIFDSQNDNVAAGNGGYPGALCRDFQHIFSQNCQCVRPGTAVTQCIQQETLDQPCDPLQDSDQCCTGSCRYVKAFRLHVCTHRAGDPAPPMEAPVERPFLFPTPSPTIAPTSFPTSSPTRLPTRLPTSSPTQSNVNDELDTPITEVSDFAGFSSSFLEMVHGTPAPTPHPKSIFQSGGGAGGRGNPSGGSPPKHQ